MIKCKRVLLMEEEGVEMGEGGMEAGGEGGDRSEAAQTRNQTFGLSCLSLDGVA